MSSVYACSARTNPVSESELQPPAGSTSTGDRRRVCGGGNVENTVLSGDAMLSMLEKSMLAPAPFENNTAYPT
jgi:hypothetical protein